MTFEFLFFFMSTQAHVYIKGEVIGVGFRAWTKIQAKITGVKGWVRNNFERQDVFGKTGGVEALLQGEESAVEKLIEIISKGSPVSRVDDVEIFWQKPTEIWESFEMRK